MPFEELEVETKENKLPTATISYMRLKRKLKNGGMSERSTQPRLLVYIPSAVMVSKKNRFVLQIDKIGKKLRVVGVASKTKNSVPFTSMMHAIRFAFGFVPYLGDAAADATECKMTKVDEDTYEITSPEWFKPED